MIHKYVPDARVAIGHGQMKPEELEKIILDVTLFDKAVCFEQRGQAVHIV